MDILKSRNLAVGVVLTAALGLTACGNQQLETWGDMGIIEVNDGQAVAVECVAQNNDPDDQYLINFNGPDIALVKKSSDDVGRPFGYTVTLTSGMDGSLKKFLDTFGSDDPAAYHGLTDPLVNDKKDQKVTAPCQEDLGNARNLSPEFVGKVVFLKRSYDIKTLNKISNLRGPIDGMNVITNDRSLLQDNGQPLISQDVFYK